MEDSTDEHYTLGARIMILTATASTVEENNLLQFALQLLHSNCPPAERPSSSDLIQWLWQHHLDSLQGQAFELSDVQTFFDIPYIKDSKLRNKHSRILLQFWSKSFLEHPALLAGCVCVYLLKRSKTCTRFLRNLHDEPLIALLSTYLH